MAAKQTGVERYRGSLVGLAVGDALGTTLEFKPPGSFEPLHDMVGGGPFQLLPGQWTDDTSLALCLAQSLVDCRGFSAQDQMERYVKWYQEGYFSSTGICFSIGRGTQEAIKRYLITGEPFSGSEDPRSSGNGSIMRLAPVPLYFANDPVRAMEHCIQSSKTTHASRECLDACRLLGALLIGAANGVSKTELLAANYHPFPDYWTKHPLTPQIAKIAAGSYWHNDPPIIRGRGYVVDCLEAALWAFSRTDKFDDGVLLAVNLGDDADTTGAVYGQLAGAYYGENAILPTWRTRLWKYSTITALAEQIYEQSKRALP